MELVVIFHPRVSIFLEPIGSTTTAGGQVPSICLSPSPGRCQARREPQDGTVDGFRADGHFQLPLWSFLHLLQVSQHRWSAMGPWAASPSQRWRQVPTWEEVGESQSRRLEARHCHGNRPCGGCHVIRALWWLVLGQVWSPVSVAQAQAWLPFPVSQGIPLTSGWWQKSYFRNPGTPTRDKQGGTCLPSQNKQTNKTSAQSLSPPEPGEVSC